MKAFNKITACILSLVLSLSFILPASAAVTSISVEDGVLTLSGNASPNELLGIYTMADDKSYGNDEAELADIKYMNFTAADENGSYTYKSLVDADDIIYISGQNGENETVRMSDYIIKYNVYLSPDGSDSNSGTKDSPFLTVEKAQAEVKNIKASADYEGGDIAINFLSGTYRVADRIYINSDDTGNEDGRVVYRAEVKNGEEVILTHATELPIRAFTAVTDKSVLKKIPVEAQSDVKVMELTGYIPENGYIGYGVLKNMLARGEGVSGYSRVYLNGKQQTIARWPNVGYKPFTLSDGTSAIGQNTAKANGINGAIELKYDEPNPNRWVTASNMAIRGYFSQSYWGYSYAVKDINRTTNTITLENVYDRTANVDANFTADRRWYAENLLEELDMPGEYYIDAEAKKLYYYPAYELRADDSLEIIATENDGRSIIAIEDASYVTLEGLTVEKSGYKGISITNGNNIIIDGCNVGYTASSGIEGVTYEVRNVTVKNCSIYNTAGNGILFEARNAGNTVLTDAQFASLEGTGFEVINNHVYNSGLNNMYMIQGISVSGIKDIVKNNTIHRTTLAGVGFTSTDGEASYNEIYKAVYDTTDTGAMHVGGDWHKLGIKVNYNYIHDLGIEGFDGQGSAWPIAGIYWDNAMSFTSQENNIVVNDAEGETRGLFMNGGRNHTAKGNVFVGNKEAFVNTDTFSMYPFSYTSETTVSTGNPILDELKTVFSPFYETAKNTNSPIYQKFGEQMDELYRDINTDGSFTAKNLELEGNVLVENDAEKRFGQTLDGEKSMQKHTGWNADTNKSNYEWITVDNTSTVKADNYVADSQTRGDIFVDAENGDYRVSEAGKTALGVGGDFVLDEDFDLGSIGCDTLPELGDGFRKIYPVNGEVTHSANVNLVWESALYADEYDWVVYKNGAAVASGTTMYNNATVALDADTEYTWEVRARYTSAVEKAKNKQDTAWVSLGGVQTFRTTGYNVLAENIALSADKKTLYFDYENTTSNTVSANIIIASYEENRLTWCDMFYVSIEPGKKVTEIPTEDAEIPDGDLKAFVWSSDGRIKPFTDSAIMVR